MQGRGGRDGCFGSAEPAADRREHLPAPRVRRRYRPEIELIRSTEGEKGRQIENVAEYQQDRNGYAADGFGSLQKTARDRQNVFASLMEAVKTHSLGQISHALYDVGGEYRRNM